MSEVAGDGLSPAASQSEEISRDVPVQKSYATVVGKPSLSKFNVDVSVVDGKATVVVPDSVVEDSVPLWEDFLVGRFPTTAPHVAKVHVIVNKIWNLGDKSIKIDAFSVNDTTIKFRIRHVSARTRVLRRGMWNICGLPMTVSKWTPIVEEAQPEIQSMPMWVVIKNVPHSMFTWPGLSFLASPVGEPKRLHQETELVTNFEEAKIFVEVDLTKELPKEYFFQVKGEEFCVEFVYPWLPQRCGTCGKWGHENSVCLTNGSKKGVSTVATPTKVTSGIETCSTDSKALETLQKSAESKSVAVDAEKTVIDSEEKEEGEISVGQKSPNEDGWQLASSGGRHSAKKSQSLEHGQASIASPSRFEILRHQLEEGETETEEPITTDVGSVSGQNLIASGTDKAVVLDEDQGVHDSNTQSSSRAEKDVGAARPTLPRTSKSAHKVLSGAVQKPKPQSGISKRTSKKHH